MPLPRLFVPFAAGIVFYLQWGMTIASVWIYAGLLFSLLLWLLVWKFEQGRYLSRWSHGLIISVFLFFGSWLIARQHNQLLEHRHFSNYPSKEAYLLVQLTEPISERTNSFRAVARVVAVGNDSLMHGTRGKLMLYFEKDTLVNLLRYGDRLIIKSTYNRVSPPRNPYAFNYQAFLAQNNVFHSTYIRAGQWHIEDRNRGIVMIRWALTIRQAALNIFEDNHLSGREFAVISALLLGYREYLDDDLRREFAGAGAMHILCVSGLHVGIIFMVLKNMFSFLCRIPHGRTLRTLLVIGLIWFYAAITGFSPSVLRASVMFSFVAVGHSFRRPTNIYNTLAASAFVLTITNPYIITYIGFQLSYLAVISIVALQPPLYQILKTKHKLLDKAWSIITVSVAAQLATGPLALYYFNQFPNYFILTNLIVIPLASTIIYTSLVTLIISPIPLVTDLMGKALSLIVALLHHSVRIIEGLPYATTTGLFLSLTETLLIFLLIVFACLYLMKNNRSALLGFLGVALLLMTSVSCRGIANTVQHHFVVYSANQATIVDFFSGEHLITIACDRIAADHRQQDFVVSGMRLRHGSNAPALQMPLDMVDTVSLKHTFARKGDLVFFRDKRMLLVHDNQRAVLYQGMEGAFETDYLLIAGNPGLDMKNLLNSVRAEMVIIDASNSHRNTARWVQACEEAGVQVWNVREQGAFMSRLVNKRLVNKDDDS
ncbi:MAG: ComEC/Rec2 family competence protein [Bacteroidales bacterium]|nr:ComEC/Rec2 family competence protein [Bacteroidales bacterium]